MSFFSTGEGSTFGRDKSIFATSFDVSQTIFSLEGLSRLSFSGIFSDFSTSSSFGEATGSGTDFDVSGLQTGRLSVSKSLSHSFKVSSI